MHLGKTINKKFLNDIPNSVNRRTYKQRTRKMTDKINQDLGIIISPDVKSHHNINKVKKNYRSFYCAFVRSQLNLLNPLRLRVRQDMLRKCNEYKEEQLSEPGNKQPWVTVIDRRNSI
jgi:hypothetical protein